MGIKVYKGSSRWLEEMAKDKGIFAVHLCGIPTQEQVDCMQALQGFRMCV
jgi:hypothetical protein